MYFDTAPYYDLIHSYKDYDTETNLLVSIIRAQNADAQTVLDVACGTGEHAKRLARDFAVDGIDIKPAFVELAKSKVPSGEFHAADMRNFRTGKKHDVVLCLFSSIAYLTDETDALSALRCFADHLAPGGLVVIEPWFTPDGWSYARPWLAPAVDEGATALCGMTTSRQDGDICVVEFQYLIGEGSTIRHVKEQHRLRMYTVKQMMDLFERASLIATYLPDALNDRGLYLARRR